MWFWTGNLLPVRQWDTHCSLFSFIVCPCLTIFPLNSWVQIHHHTGHAQPDVSGVSSMWSTLVLGLGVVVWPTWNECIWVLMSWEPGSWEEWSLLTISQVWQCLSRRTDVGGTQINFDYVVRFCFKATPNKRKQVGYTCKSTSPKIERGGFQLGLYSETLS